MFDIVCVMAFLIGAGYIFVAITNYDQIVTKWYGTKRRGSLGIKSISGSVRQMRGWLLAMGVLACTLALLGIFAPSH
jgi:hypothetical protein